MNEPIRTLAHMNTGDCATITRIHTNDPQVQRLMMLGLVEGVTVRLAGRAFGGDPMEFHLFGCGISLRREQAKRFEIDAAT